MSNFKLLDGIIGLLFNPGKYTIPRLKAWPCLRKMECPEHERITAHRCHV